MFITKYSSQLFVFLLSLTFVLLFCTEPTEPNYKASLGDKLIQTYGSSILDSTLLLYVSAEGDLPITYTWSNNGTAIPGSNSDTLILSPVKASDAGNYVCIVSNAIGSDTSLPYALMVYFPPSIISHPQDDSISVGDSATFRVQASGTSPLSYQWQRDGNNIAGATDSNCTTPATTEVDNNTRYRCLVTNSYGFITSNAALLTVSGTVIKPTITKHPQNKSVIVGDSATFFATATGTRPFTYQWQKDSVTISGAIGSTYTTPAVDTTDSGNAYRCIITNSAGSDTSDAAILNVTENAVKPEITTQPLNQQISVGDSTTVSITATGTSPITFQWQKDTTDLTNETGTSLTIRNATLNDNNTRYRCIVTNSVGADTSDCCTLTVVNNQRPPEWVRDTMRVSVIEMSTFSIDLEDSCTDPDGDIITFTLLTGAPAGDTVTSSKRYTYTPGFTDAGIYSVTLQAHDGTDSSTAVLHLTVIDSNRAPTFKDSLPIHSYRLKEGELLTIKYEAEDADNDTVIIFLDTTSSTLPRKTTIDFTTTQLTWQSMTSDSGLFNVRLGASDKKDTTLITVQVAIGVNLPPIISVAGYTTGETAIVKEKIELALQVVATDPDTGQTATLLPARNLPTTGSTFDTATGDFAYTGDFGISNQQTNTIFSNITFFATDNMSRAIDSFVIHIQVLDSNRAPLASDTSITAQEKVTTPVNIFAVDPDTDAMTWTISQAPKLGSGDVSSGSISSTTHEFSYTSNDLSATGYDTLEVTLSDDEDQSTMNVFITVQANNAPPIIDHAPSVDAVEDNTTAYPINLDGHDPEGSAVRWYVNVLPKKGSLDKLEGDVSTGIEMLYTLKADSCGKDSLTFYLLDAQDNSSDTQAIYITIDSVNDAPVISGQSGTISCDEDQELQLALTHINVTDIDNNPSELTLIVTDGTNYNIVSGTIIKPDQDYNGPLTVQIKVNDGVDESNVFGLNVTVNAVNDPPVINNQNTTPSCDEDNNLTLQLTHLDVTDVDNGAGDLTLVVIDDANYSIVSGTTIRPDQNYNGALTLKVKVSDLEDESAVFDMAVTVNSVNDKPDITITSYDASQPFGTAVNITTTFSDVDNNIKSIQYMVDSKVDFDGPVSGTTHPHTWTAAFGPNVIGSHSVFAIITDSLGGKDSSQTVTTTITGTLASDTLSIWGILNAPGQETYVTAISEVTTISNGRIQTLEFHSPWGTEITKLTAHIGNLSQLENLICDDCGSIQNLPNDLGRLNNLTYLKLNGCGLSSLPNEIVNLTTLSYLNLEFNNLTDLPSDIFNLVNIAVNDLDLADNLLTPYPNPPEPWEQWATDRDPDWRTTQRSK